MKENSQAAFSSGYSIFSPRLLSVSLSHKEEEEEEEQQQQQQQQPLSHASA